MAVGVGVGVDVGVDVAVDVDVGGGVNGQRPPAEISCLSPRFNNKWQRMLPLGGSGGALAPPSHFRGLWVGNAPPLLGYPDLPADQILSCPETHYDKYTTVCLSF